MMGRGLVRWQYVGASLPGGVAGSVRLGRGAVVWSADPVERVGGYRVVYVSADGGLGVLLPGEVLRRLPGDGLEG